MKITKLALALDNEAAYVRLVSGLFPGGLTKKEMMIVILLLKLQEQTGSKNLTQEMKERVRLHLEISSQTMHNYWNKLKQKNVVIGNYSTYKFNPIFQHNVELKVTFSQ